MEASCETYMDFILSNELAPLAIQPLPPASTQLLKSLTLTVPNFSGNFQLLPNIKKTLKLFQNCFLQQPLREGGKPPKKKPKLVCSKVAYLQQTLEQKKGGNINIVVLPSSLSPTKRQNAMSFISGSSSSRLLTQSFP